MKLLKNKDHQELLDKIDLLTESVQNTNLQAAKYKDKIENIIFVINYYNSNRCGGTKLISNISYLLGLGDIPNKYKILKDK